MSKRRIVAALLAMLMVAGSAAGCKPNEEETSTPGESSGEVSTEPTESQAEEGSYPVVDLGGYEFVVADCLRYGDYEIPAEGTSLQWDAFWENKRQVESDLNCTITYNFYDPVSGFDTIFPELMAGEKVSDILFTAFHALGSYINSDMLVDLQEMPGVNLNAKYWNQAITKASTMNGKTWATCNDMQYLDNRVGGVFYNRTLVNKLGLTDPYDLVKNDQWTFDKFREMALAATKDNGDGNWTDADTYGFVGVNLGVNFYFAGGNRVTNVVDGKMKFTMNTPQALETINFFQKLRWNDGVFFQLPEGENWMKWHNMFSEGKSLFLICTISEAEYLREMEDEFGWVPMPKGPQATSYAAPIEWNSAVMSILKTNTDLDKTGPVVEALAYLGHRIHESAAEELYEILLNGDEKSKEMHELTLENQVFDVYQTNVVPQIVNCFNEVLEAQNNDPAATIQSNEEAIQISIDNAFNAG